MCERERERERAKNLKEKHPLQFVFFVDASDEHPKQDR